MKSTDPAFPRPMSENRYNGDQPDGNRNVDDQEGMSVRTWLAGKALQGLLANPAIVTDLAVLAQQSGNNALKAVAHIWQGAVKHADGTLAELAKEEPK